MSIGFAGCSADMSTRMSQNSFSNPFASQEATGSVPTPAVERRELPQYARPQSQYQSAALPPPISAPQSYPAANSGVSGGGRGVASYSPPAHPPLETTGSVAPRSVRGPRRCRAAPRSSSAPATRSKYWRAAIMFQPAAIMQANGYKGPRALRPASN